MFDLLVLGLACWRLTSLLLYERGPKATFAMFRQHFGIANDEDGEPQSWPDTEAGMLLRCLDCASVWIALVLVLAWLLRPWVTVCVCLPFAVSALAILIGRLLEVNRG